MRGARMLRTALGPVIALVRLVAQHVGVEVLRFGVAIHMLSHCPLNSICDENRVAVAKRRLPVMERLPHFGAAHPRVALLLALLRRAKRNRRPELRTRKVTGGAGTR